MTVCGCGCELAGGMQAEIDALGGLVECVDVATLVGVREQIAVLQHTPTLLPTLQSTTCASNKRGGGGGR